MSYRTTPKYQAVISFFVLCAIISSIFSIPLASANADYAWTEQMNSQEKSWKQIAVSANGMKIFAITSNPDFIYASTDGGNTWNTVADSRSWSGITVSSDGTHVAASTNGGLVWTSDTSGSAWATNSDASGSKSWSAISSSADGSTIVATEWAGSIYVSTTTGQTWAQYFDEGGKWTTVAMSADGSNIVAFADTNSAAVSNDYGQTWNSYATPSINQCWGYIGGTPNFEKILAGDCKPGSIYVSTNGGTTWDATNSGDGVWYSVKPSGDGQVVVAADNAGSIKVSLDGGATWEAQSTIGTKPWTYATISEDGSKIIAAANGSKIFTASFFTPPPTVTVPSIATSTPTDVSTTTVTLNATITFDGNASTTVTGFNWGDTDAYGNTATSSTPLGTGEIFSQALSGLLCASSYHYQAFASNSAGTATSSDEIFTTNLCDVVSTSTPPATTTPPTDTGTSTASTTDTSVTGDNDGEGSHSGTSRRSIIGSISGGQGGSSSGSNSAGSAITSGTANSCALVGNLRPGSEGSEVVKLQNMLNKLTDAGITANSVYGPATKDAVKAFQTKYSDEILAPWGMTEPTGVVSFTTRKKLNELSCGETFTLSPIELYLINQFKNNPNPTAAVEGTATTTDPRGTEVPVEVGATTPAANDTQSASVINSGTTGGLFQKIGNFFKKIF